MGVCHPPLPFLGCGHPVGSALYGGGLSAGPRGRAFSPPMAPVPRCSTNILNPNMLNAVLVLLAHLACRGVLQSVLQPFACCTPCMPWRVAASASASASHLLESIPPRVESCAARVCRGVQTDGSARLTVVSAPVAWRMRLESGQESVTFRVLDGCVCDIATPGRRQWPGACLLSRVIYSGHALNVAPGLGTWHQTHGALLRCGAPRLALPLTPLTL